MAFDKDQFRGLIVDVLKEADLYSPAAVELLMLTCAVESNFGTYIEQITGPALGVFQMEPRTHLDIWKNYLHYKEELNVIVDSFTSVRSEASSTEDLRRNLAYSIVMARVHYLRVPTALPNANDTLALAHYWKKHYNTHLGSGTVEKAIEKYRQFCV